MTGFARGHVERPFVKVVDASSGTQRPSRLTLCEMNASNDPQELANALGGVLDDIRRDTTNTGCVAFPECTIPAGAVEELRSFASNEQIVVIGGLLPDGRQRNRAVVATPTGAIYYAEKLHASRYEPGGVRGGNSVLIARGTPIGDVGIVICFDFTSDSTISTLWDHVDVLLVLSQNPASELFIENASALAYRHYRYVAVCNTYPAGGSVVVAPTREPLACGPARSCGSFKTQTYEVDPVGLSKAMSGVRHQAGLTFRSPPAGSGWRRRGVHATAPSTAHTLHDWPEPFDRGSRLIIGKDVGPLTMAAAEHLRACLGASLDRQGSSSPIQSDHRPSLGTSPMILIAVDHSSSLFATVQAAFEGEISHRQAVPPDWLQHDGDLGWGRTAREGPPGLAPGHSWAAMRLLRNPWHNPSSEAPVLWIFGGSDSAIAQTTMDLAKAAGEDFRHSPVGGAWVHSDGSLRKI